MKNIKLKTFLVMFVQIKLDVIVFLGFLPSSEWASRESYSFLSHPSKIGAQNGMVFRHEQCNFDKIIYITFQGIWNLNEKSHGKLKVPNI